LASAGTGVLAMLAMYRQQFAIIFKTFRETVMDFIANVENSTHASPQITDESPVNHRQITDESPTNHRQITDGSPIDRRRIIIFGSLKDQTL